jgi:DNA-binding helix-hairpin-helix protein with protein kinase domain
MEKLIAAHTELRDALFPCSRRALRIAQIEYESCACSNMDRNNDSISSTCESCPTTFFLTLCDPAVAAVVHIQPAPSANRNRKLQLSPLGELQVAMTPRSRFADAAFCEGRSGISPAQCSDGHGPDI